MYTSGCDDFSQQGLVAGFDLYRPTGYVNKECDCQYNPGFTKVASRSGCHNFVEIKLEYEESSKPHTIDECDHACTMHES